MRTRIFFAGLVLAMLCFIPSAGAVDTRHTRDPITVQTANIAAASVTASAVGSANAIATLSAEKVLCIVTNSLNQPVWLSYNAANWVWLPASTGFAIDLSAANRRMLSGKVIGIYHDGAAPTTGKLGVSCI